MRRPRGKSTRKLQAVARTQNAAMRLKQDDRYDHAFMFLLKKQALSQLLIGQHPRFLSSITQMAKGASLPHEEVVELGLDPTQQLGSTQSLPSFLILSLNSPTLFPPSYYFRDPNSFAPFLMWLSIKKQKVPLRQSFHGFSKFTEYLDILRSHTTQPLAKFPYSASKDFPKPVFPKPPVDPPCTHSTPTPHQKLSSVSHIFR